MTPFLKYHPGRKSQLMRGAGNDCTSLFDQVRVCIRSLYSAILRMCRAKLKIAIWHTVNPEMLMLH